MNALLDNRIPPPLVALLCAVGAWYCAKLTANTALVFGPWHLLAVLLLLKSVYVGVAGMLEFRRQRTTVNPLTPDKASALVTGGIFRYTRNPMYVALATLLLALAFALGNALAFLWAALFVLYIQLFQIYPEERAMHELFGEEFKLYCTKVRRWL